MGHFVQQYSRRLKTFFHPISTRLNYTLHNKNNQGITFKQKKNETEITEKAYKWITEMNVKITPELIVGKTDYFKHFSNKIYLNSKPHKVHDCLRFLYITKQKRVNKVQSSLFLVFITLRYYSVHILKYFCCNKWKSAWYWVQNVKLIISWCILSAHVDFFETIYCRNICLLSKIYN